MHNTPYLTKGHSDMLEHQIRTTRSGMAHFANTGPFGTVCGECQYWGYHKTRRTASGDAVKTKHVRACAKFRCFMAQIEVQPARDSFKERNVVDFIVEPGDPAYRPRRSTSKQMVTAPKPEPRPSLASELNDELPEF
jgi:hypothetical protein